MHPASSININPDKICEGDIQRMQRNTYMHMFILILLLKPGVETLYKLIVLRDYPKLKGTTLGSLGGVFKFKKSGPS